MSTFLFSNSASTTLASSLSPSDTLVQVAVGTGAEFPAPGPGEQFAVTLQDAATGLIEEIVYCTAVSGDNLTVVRAQEGTAAVSWGVGDLASNYWTAGQAAALVQIGVVQKQATNWTGATAGTNAMTAALSPSISAYSQIDGSPVRLLKGGLTNTGAVTLNLNGIAPKPVVYPGGAPLAAGAIGAGAVFEVVYDSGLDSFQMTSAPTIGSPTGVLGGDLAGSSLPNALVKANGITNAKLAQMVAMTVKANILGSTADPDDVPILGFLAALGIDLTNLGDPGWIQIGPFLAQWATVTQADDSYGSHALPIAFTSAFYGAEATIKFNNVPPKSGGNGGGATWYPIDLGHIGLLMAWNGDSTGINTITYFAWGKMTT